MTMTLAKPDLGDRFPGFALLPTAAADYDIVRRAIAHIRGNWRAQPEIETIADAAGVTPTDLHHLFRRWCGLTPKAFLQALTLNHARELPRFIQNGFKVRRVQRIDPIQHPFEIALNHGQGRSQFVRNVREQSAAFRIVGLQARGHFIKGTRE